MESDGAPFTPSLCQCSILRVFKSTATLVPGEYSLTLTKRECTTEQGPWGIFFTIAIRLCTTEQDPREHYLLHILSKGFLVGIRLINDVSLRSLL